MSWWYRFIRYWYEYIFVRQCRNQSSPYIGFPRTVIPSSSNGVSPMSLQCCDESSGAIVLFGLCRRSLTRNKKIIILPTDAISYTSNPSCKPRTYIKVKCSQNLYINDDVVYIQIVCIYFFYHGNTTSVMIHWLQEKKVYKHTFIRTIGELFDFQ